MRVAGLPVAEGWKAKYGGLEVSEAKRQRQLEKKYCDAAKTSARE